MTIKNFFNTIGGAMTKDLLICAEDIQILQGFDSAELNNCLFKKNVFVGLKPLWNANPDVKIYSIA